MNDLDASVRPRRLVLEVAQPRPQKNEGAQRKRRRRRKKKQFTEPQRFEPQVACTECGNDYDGSCEHDDAQWSAEDSEVMQGVPMELQPLILEAMSYGRKTHALGMMKVASTLSSIATKLRALKVQDDAIQRLIVEAEQESTRIVEMMGSAYNEGTDASA